MSLFLSRSIKASISPNNFKRNLHNANLLVFDFDIFAYTGYVIQSTLHNVTYDFFFAPPFA